MAATLRSWGSQRKSWSIEMGRICFPSDIIKWMNEWVLETALPTHFIMCDNMHSFLFYPFELVWHLLQDKESWYRLLSVLGTHGKERHTFHRQGKTYKHVQIHMPVHTCGHEYAVMHLQTLVWEDTCLDAYTQSQKAGTHKHMNPVMNSCLHHPDIHTQSQTHSNTHSGIHLLQKVPTPYSLFLQLYK